MGAGGENVENAGIDWACEAPRKKFAIPYNFAETMSWLKNNLFGPSRKFKKLTRFLPQKCVLNPITPQLKLGFLGDIMQMKRKKLQIGSSVKDFLRGVDYLIGNFEGTISGGKKVFMAQAHTAQILETLSTLFPPERFVLGCANNHSGDFGWTEFNKSYELLKEQGFLTIGRKDEPRIILEKQVNVVSCTIWSNQKCRYVPYFEEAEKAFDEQINFNVLFPHWGYEQQLYPNPSQIALAQQLLTKWDLIVGHHSHCPQPITAYEIEARQKAVSYSLGDFCTHLNLKKYRFGIILKLTIGPSTDGKWRVGELEWKFSHVEHLDKNQTEVIIRNTCHFFPQIS
ncbi:MAG: CapA family protein [Candidatus Helarchaeota archaeon]